MKYNLSEIMNRAWEIKRTADRQERNSLLNHNVFRDLYESEKAVFSECLKMAWEEAKRAPQKAAELGISLEEAKKIVEKETELVKHAGNVTWRIWDNYGKKRAYYTCSRWSKYQNNKKDNYVVLVA